MEFRQLEAFVVLGTELHFGRAAEKLHMSQPTLSELVRRLEREVGTPLLTRTTRRVALTGAGVELLARAQSIVSDISSAAEAVRRVAKGEISTIRLGIVPNVEPVLAPHIAKEVYKHAPEITLDVDRMWPPDLLLAVTEGTVDAAITCGYVADPPGVVGKTFCGERVLVALRSTHRLAERAEVSWPELAGERFGSPSQSLFPDWSFAQQRILEKANISPPTAELETIDVGATGWARQITVDWVMTGAALSTPDDQVTVLPVSPAEAFIYKLQWNSARTPTAATTRFIELVLSGDIPAGWLMQPGHNRFNEITAARRSEDA